MTLPFSMAQVPSNMEIDVDIDMIREIHSQQQSQLEEFFNFFEHFFSSVLLIYGNQ